MAMFATTSQTVSLTAAAARVGIGRSLAYELAHRVDSDGAAWLMPGVRIYRISSRYRVLNRELDEVLGPLQAVSA